MKKAPENKPGPALKWLLIGDLSALIAVTVFGFGSHGTLGSAGARFFAMLIPLAGAWALAGTQTGAFDLQLAMNPSQLWRPAWTMVFAAPLAIWLRSLWLGAPIVPVFVAVIGAVSALGLTLWRALYWLIGRSFLTPASE